ncbi:hypothetical protein FRC07_006644 [Ceratobasidium sp. 392]|nr:hypothetical protein FRC07_006644 [Ceratobasidium sp. 392]
MSFQQELGESYHSREAYPPKNTIPGIPSTVRSGLSTSSNALNLGEVVQKGNFPNADSSVSQPHSLIILMGPTGAGKSTVRNVLLGSIYRIHTSQFINRVAQSTLAVSTSLLSCTQQVAFVDFELEDGTLVKLVDTPGFNDSLRSDLEVLDEIATALKTWGEKDFNIHGVIYLHRISDLRMSGSSRKSLTAFLNICGEQAMSHVSIVTNMWGSISYEEGETREAELRLDDLFFKKPIAAGAQILRNDNPPTSTREILRQAIRPNPVQLLIQKELLDDESDLLETTAGAELNREMAEQRAQHEAELQKISQEYELAQQQQDAETQEELEEERENLKRKIEGMQSAIDRMQERKKVQLTHAQKRVTNPQVSNRRATASRVRSVSPSSGGIAVEQSQWTTNPTGIRTDAPHSVSPRKHDAGWKEKVKEKVMGFFGFGDSRSVREM